VYRWWLENTIWFATNFNRRALSEEETAYLAHLQREAQS
jgi:hypothetical protein